MSSLKNSHKTNTEFCNCHPSTWGAHWPPCCHSLPWHCSPLGYRHRTLCWAQGFTPVDTSQPTWSHFTDEGPGTQKRRLPKATLFESSYSPQDRILCCLKGNNQDQISNISAHLQFICKSQWWESFARNLADCATCPHSSSVATPTEALPRGPESAFRSMRTAENPALKSYPPLSKSCQACLSMSAPHHWAKGYPKSQTQRRRVIPPVYLPTSVPPSTSYVLCGFFLC